MADCLIAIGANLGDREATIRRAIGSLALHPQVDITEESRLYVTKPAGGPPGQGDFLNGAVRLQTDLGPLELLELLQVIESSLGRTREVKWGPRTLDLDLLLYDDEVIDQPNLKVPHPRMHQRRFVLEAAAEIAAEMVHPTLRQTVQELLAACPGSA